MLVVPDGPISVTTDDRSQRFELTLEQWYRITKSDEPADEPWSVSTAGYRYIVQSGDARDELVAWHWHPQSTREKTHLHVYDGPLNRLHLPTSRVSIESVIEFLIRDLGVATQRSDWEDVLDEAHTNFVKYRSWP